MLKYDKYPLKKVILKWLFNKTSYSVEDYFKITVYDIKF